MDKELPRKILIELRNLYDLYPTAVIPTWELAQKLNIPENEVQGGMIYLKDKDMIKSFLQGDEWVQKISAEGLDELLSLENQNPFEINEEYLELDVIHEDHTGKIKAFISHKFAKSDQILADTLRKSLDENNIYGYIATRKRNYDLVFGEKIKNEINSSDYLVAIITKNSQFAPSIHQEIGYALGVNVPVRIMAEDQEAKGVLAEGKDIEKFSRDSFEKYLDNIIKDIIKNGIRKKLTDPEKKDLIQNIYEPCYNQMKNVFDQRETTYEIPANPWEKVSNFWKLKTETDMKELFENYTNNQKIYRDAWKNLGKTLNDRKGRLSDIIKPAFEKFQIIDHDGDIPLSDNSVLPLGGFIENFRGVIFNDDVSNPSDFYENLHHYASKTALGLIPLLEKWKSENPELYFEILSKIPELVKTLESKYTHQQIEHQRKILKKSIEELTFALEEKLK